VTRGIVLASFGSPLEAELARAFLESREISCSVVDAIHEAGSPLEAAFGRPLSSALRGVRVYVDTEDAERARAALEEYTSTLNGPNSYRETNDELVARAFRAFLGSALLPGLLNLLSLWLLRDVDYSALQPRRRRHFWIVLILNLAALATIAYLIVRPSWPRAG
jgi:hypothetical protein